MKPVLLPDGECDAQRLAQALRRLDGAMPAELSDFIYRMLSTFPGE